MNYYGKVAEMLGVELDERFSIKNSCVKIDYYFSEKDGLRYDGGNLDLSKALNDILSGHLEIIKQPWFPKDYEKFYVLNPKGIIIETRKLKTNYRSYSDYNQELKNIFSNGFGFKTEQEAYDKGISLGWTMMPLGTR